MRWLASLHIRRVDIQVHNLHARGLACLLNVAIVIGRLKCPKVLSRARQLDTWAMNGCIMLLENGPIHDLQLRRPCWFVSLSFNRRRCLEIDELRLTGLSMKS